MRDDPVAIGERLTIDPAQPDVLRPRLRSGKYATYDTWCRDNRERAKSGVWLWSKRSERGVTKEKRSTGMLYRGIGLRHEGEL